MNKSQVQLILKQLNIIPRRRFGQNFLIDKNIAKKIIHESKLSKNDEVLEIGPGLGALTELLVHRVKKLYAVEIEPQFCLYLRKRFSENDNLEIINKDILKSELPFHNKVVSNIPYSITGPLLEKIFFIENPPHGILTVEKKISDRIFYKNDYKNISRISISLNSFMEPISRFNLSRRSFYPAPKIDLTLIKINPRKNINPFLLENKSRKFYLKFIAGIMPYKNKNVANAIELFFKKEKEKISHVLQNNNIKNKKVFRLEIKDFIELAKLFY